VCRAHIHAIDYALSGLIGVAGRLVGRCPTLLIKGFQPLATLNVVETGIFLRCRILLIFIHLKRSQLTGLLATDSR
jgi:hypothetical protein